MSFTLDVRPEVAAFALAMERKLRENDHKGGWGDESHAYLIGRVHGETKELERAVAEHESPTSALSQCDVLDEAADVANFAMMVADRCDALHPPIAEAAEELAERLEAMKQLDAYEAEATHLTAELDKHNAPPASTLAGRVRALVIERKKVADAIAGRVGDEIAKARANPERRLPRERNGMTRKITIAGEHDMYVTVNCFDDGKPGEIFLKMAKQGSTLSGLLDALAMSVSRGLKQGVPIAWYCHKFQNLRFDPAGATGDPAMPFVSSPLDAAFKWLAIKFPSEGG